MATLHAPAFELPEILNTKTNLADARIGAQVIECSDDFFAEAKRMLQFEAPIFVEDKFDDHGKWMDGWETRRKRHAGYDWCIVKLGVSGKISALDIDTTFFTGNYPASASLEACYAPNGDLTGAKWQSILENTELGPSQHHIFMVNNDAIFTHIRLNIFPDGGVARLRVYGDVHIQVTDHEQTLDLLALENGGRVIAYSDAHFGHPRNLINPGRGV
ncbi:allantoicase, partial [Acinetobacter baumannii]